MIGEKIRSLRETNNMLIREVAAQLQMPFDKEYELANQMTKL